MPSIRMQQEWSDIPAGVGQLLLWLRDAENSVAETTWRTEAAEDYRFYAGDQDYDYVKMKLAAQKRPVTVYNEVKPKIDMLIGLAARGKHDTTLVPVGGEDEALSELMSGVLKHYRKQLKMTRKELDCFEHTVKSGRSLLHFWVDTMNPFEPKLCCRRVRGYNFFCDSNAQEYDLSDARYLFIEKWLCEEDIKVKYPQIDIHSLQGFGSQYADMPQFFNEARDLYRIMEGWFYKYEEVYYFVNPMNGEVDSCKANERQYVAEGLAGQQVDVSQLQFVKGMKKIPCYCIFSGNQVLEEGASQLKWEGFPAVLFGAYRNEDTNAWFSPITMMKDPQRSVNVMRRQLSHLLQTLPKGILATEVGMILNIEEYEERSSEPNFYLEVAKGGIDKFKFVQQPSISPIYAQFDQISSQAIKDSSGIQDPLMGVQQSSREAGITDRQRQETGIAVLYLLFSNFQESRHNATRLLMSLIQQYVTMPQIVRIEGENGEQLMSINTQLQRGNQGFNDITAMKFDLEVADTAETATMRLTIAQILAEVNHNNPGSIPPDIILEYSDIPYSVKQRVKSNFEAQQQQAAQQAQLEAQRIQAEVEIKQAELQIKQVELQIKQAELDLKEKEITINAGMKQQELETKRMDVLLKNRDKPEPPPGAAGPGNRNGSGSGKPQNKQPRKGK